MQHTFTHCSQHAFAVPTAARDGCLMEFVWQTGSYRLFASPKLECIMRKQPKKLLNTYHFSCKVADMWGVML